MKTLLISTAILVLISQCIFIGFGQGKDNQKKKQAQEQAGKNNKGQNQDKKQDQNSKVEKGQGKAKSERDDKTVTGKGDKPRNIKVIERNPRGKEDVTKIVSIHGRDNVFVWDRKKFEDRDKIRDEGKVTVCHKFNQPDEPPVTINISRNALRAHLNHGDVQGSCASYNGSRRLSDIFIRKRNDYYNTIYIAQDQVVYSQSILDYALQRLTGVRSELVVLQNANAPAAEIQRKQAIILELEDNISLLEAAIGVTAGILVAKLAQ